MKAPVGPTPYDRAKAAGLLGMWLVARTPLDRPYPCRCSLGRRCMKRCWCAGRTDDTVPAHCCGRLRETPANECAA